jgi:hypothetical protein
VKPNENASSVNTEDASDASDANAPTAQALPGKYLYLLPTMELIPSWEASLSYSRNSQPFMQPEGLLPSANGTYPKPDESSPYPPILFVLNKF